VRHEHSNLDLVSKLFTLTRIYWHCDGVLKVEGQERSATSSMREIGRRRRRFVAVANYPELKDPIDARTLSLKRLNATAGLTRRSVPP
jgi:hypothetical protein